MNEREQTSADRVLDLVGEALQYAPAERAAFLFAACGTDEALRAEVQSLLEQEAGAEKFLNAPAFAGQAVHLFGDEQGELKPGDKLGDCLILKLLGEGGMGEVYLAQDTGLERQVAVKLLKRQLDDQALLRRFRHERKVLAALTHPNIARLYGGALTPEGRAYLVMEYVEGERLDRYCDAQGLDIAARLALFRKVCAAVTYAHQNLVVHRDLKPANIRVTPEGEPKLLDFGIAKLLDPDNTRNADVTVTMFPALTPEYASPEQLRGEPITTASDVYSLGVILYELLTGERPYQFNHRRPDELARAICEQEPARPSTVAGRRATTTPDARVCGELPGRLRRRLAGDLDNIVAMALRKEPARRYATVNQFSEDLRRQGEGLPVSARKDTLRYRADRFVRRNKAGAAAAVFVALALVGGLVATSWQARVARQERDRARDAQARAELAQRQTEQAKKQADRLNAFLENLLGSADPTKMGKDVKVVQVLDAAGKNIDHDLAAEPEILADAHQTLCAVYSQLGILDPAEQQASAACQIVRRLHGGDSPAAAHAEAILADVLSKRNRFGEAEPLLRHALAIWQKQTHSDPLEVGLTEDILGYICYQTKRLDDAEKILAGAQAKVRAAAGENNLSYLRVLNDLAGLELYKRDYPAAVARFHEVIALYDRLSPDNPRAIISRFNICIPLFALQNLTEMDQVVARLEQDTLRVFGEKSLYYAEAVVTHACSDFAKGDYPAAIQRLRQSLGVIEATFPPTQLTVVQCRGLLGLSLTRTGHAAEGESLLRAAYVNGGNCDRIEFAHTYGNLESALGECLLAQQKYAEAEPLLLTGYEDLKKRLGEHNAMTTQAAQRLGALYVALGKPEEAGRFQLP